jgi:hypothetical protein
MCFTAARDREIRLCMQNELTLFNDVMLVWVQKMFYECGYAQPCAWKKMFYSHSGNYRRPDRTANPFATAGFFFSPESCTKTLGRKRLRCTDAVQSFGSPKRRLRADTTDESKYVNNSRNGSISVVIPNRYSGSQCAWQKTFY